MELAFVLPVLLSIVFACIDFARFVYGYIAVSNAVRVGAEYGATHRCSNYTLTSWETRVREMLEEELQNLPGFDPSLLHASVTWSDQLDGMGIVTVEADYPFETVVHWPGIPKDVTLRRAITMQQVR